MEEFIVLLTLEQFNSLPIDEPLIDPIVGEQWKCQSEDGVWLMSECRPNENPAYVTILTREIILIDKIEKLEKHI